MEEKRLSEFLKENGAWLNEEDLRKLDRLELLNQKHKEDTYVFIIKDCMVKGNWKKFDSSDFKKDSHYKYFHISHEEILQRFLRDNTLKIQYRWHDEDWMLLEDFIENYDENMQLRITKKEFKPFTLGVEVNTLDEAKSLWNRFNLNYHSLCEAMSSEHYKVECEKRIPTYKYWKQLDNILKDLGE